ncbi:MAG TPA: NEW3 domain-containing protein [Casimicrobiaceae bacterium]|nr:NEW3 domain-containing protein [Casimicrobiaceae bacterium]
MSRIRWMFAALCLALSASAYPHVVVKASNPSLPPQASPQASIARGLTTNLTTLQAQYNAASEHGKGPLAAQIVAVSKQRHEALVALAPVDPAEVLRVRIPPDVLAGLPPQAIPWLERSADESGDLEILHVDHVNPANDYFVQTLTTTKGRHPLFVAGDLGNLLTGAKVRVKGVWIGDALVAAASDMTVTKASALPNTLGVQRTLVILVNFRDAPTQPYTAADARSVVFGTTSDFDYENSYQQTTVAGDVAGWYTIASTSATCDYNTIATQAKQAASSGGFNLSNYMRHVYVFPANACGWWGLGTVGGNPSQAWIHTRWGFTLGVVGHEMGHNLGLWHSHSMDCGSEVLATSGCSTSDYGDVFDLMGDSYSAHFNAFQKERLGWLNSGVSPPLTTLSTHPGTTTHSIAPFELSRNTQSRALKIPRGTACAATNEWLYVEARSGMSGVLVHKATEGNGNSSYLLDMTPWTDSWSDSGLMAGQSFTDSLTGLVIAPLSVGSAGAQINVTFPPSSCTRAAPRVSMSPTGTVWTSAGAAINYAVSVTNQDSCGCAATTYDVAGGVPSGWSSTNSRTASVGPGASTSTSIVVTSPSSAAAAFYDVAMNAANSTASSMVGSATGTVSIASGSSITVGAATDRSLYTLPTKGNGNVNVIITTTVRSAGSPVSGASVSVDVRDPNNAVKTLTGTTASNGSVSLTYGMRARQAAKGTYTITSRASMGGVNGSASASFVVN